MSDDQPVVLINVFSVAPKDQAMLVTLLTRATTESIAHAPGFESADLYRSVDGTKVTMHARWSSVGAYHDMRRTGGSEQTLEAALAISRFDPGVYALVRSFECK